MTRSPMSRPYVFEDRSRVAASCFSARAAAIEVAGMRWRINRAVQFSVQSYARWAVIYGRARHGGYKRLGIGVLRAFEYVVRGSLSVDEYGANLNATEFDESTADPAERATALLSEVEQ